MHDACIQEGSLKGNLLKNIIEFQALHDHGAIKLVINVSGMEPQCLVFCLGVSYSTFHMYMSRELQVTTIL